MGSSRSTPDILINKCTLDLWGLREVDYSELREILILYDSV